jgi:hypothetical protein
VIKLCSHLRYISPGNSAFYAVSHVEIFNSDSPKIPAHFLSCKNKINNDYFVTSLHSNFALVDEIGGSIDIPQIDRSTL